MPEHRSRRTIDKATKLKTAVLLAWHLLSLSLLVLLLLPECDLLRWRSLSNPLNGSNFTCARGPGAGRRLCPCDADYPGRDYEISSCSSLPLLIASREMLRPSRQQPSLLPASLFPCFWLRVCVCGSSQALPSSVHGELCTQPAKQSLVMHPKQLVVTVSVLQMLTPVVSIFLHQLELRCVWNAARFLPRVSMGLAP